MRIISPKLAVLALPAVLLLGNAVLWGYKDGPPPNMTGGFGGSTCHMCHSDGALNAPGGSLTVSGVPDRYEPGASYEVTVKLVQGAMQVGGFQIAARFADGKAAGLWSVEGDRARVAAGGFVQHTKAGVQAPAAGANEWKLKWTAPERGDVTFHAAGNASNDDASALGDLIYTAETRSIAR